MADAHVSSLAQLLRDIKSRVIPDDETTAVVSTPDHDPTAVTLVHDEPIPSTVTAKNIFRHPDAHPLVLDLLLLDKYSEEWLGWEPETIELRIPADFGVDRISDLNVAKLQSVKTLHLVDSFWERWEVFVWCAMPLCSIFPDFQVMQVPTVIQCTLAVDLANRIRDNMEWSDEIKMYLSMVHRHDGVLVPQPPLDFVEVDTVGLPLEVGKVKERWPEVRISGKTPSGETPEDEQLRRMLQVNESLRQWRGQLRQQLDLLRHG